MPIDQENNQFQREELLIGKNNLIKLQNSKVIIYGIGGVGSFVCEALARAGVGNLVLVDFDVVDETNINRQIEATHDTIGQLKTEAMKERLLKIYPKINVETYNSKQNLEDETDLIDDSVDYVVDAVDTVSAKIRLAVISNERNVPIISCMGTGNKLDPTKFEITDIYKTSVCPLAKVMRKELKKRGIPKLKVLYSKEEIRKQNFSENTESKIVPASISFVPSVAGLIIAGEVVKDLIGRGIEGRSLKSLLEGILRTVPQSLLFIFKMNFFQILVNNNSMRNKIKKIMIILMFFNIIFLFNFSKASEKKEGIENFPQNYRPYLYELKNKYPNWNFTALYTGLDWNYVIGEENIFGKNLVPKSYSDRWKNTNPGEYNVEVDAGWVDCSKQALEYTMDPRNFLNEVRIFQFETLSFEEISSTKPTIEKVLYGTEFYNRKVDYYNSSGTLISTNSLYSDLILNAGKISRVSSLHLAARIKQEVGPFLSHSSISGLVDGFKGLYNFYNIGATSSSEPMGAIKNGLQYAKDGKGMSSANKAKYLIPWDTKEKAITGGGIFIGESYINVGQNTIYLQKFDVNDERQGTLFTHQYMTNVLAPYSEGKLTYNGYKNGDILNSNLSFLIPVYENIPELPTESPNINPSDYEQDNTKMYANVQTVLNIRSGPGTSYDIVATVTKDEVMIRIAKGKQSGELWDRVVLSNGIVGYAFQSYLQELPVEPEKPIEEIQVSISKDPILKNERVPLEVKIIPEDATDTTLKYMSSDTTVAMVSDEGTILGLSSGKATITVYSEKYSVKTQIEVEVYSEVKDLILDMDSLIIQKGQTVKINATVLPEDANNKKIIYESQNPDIAQVDEDGNISGIEVGEAKLLIETQENKIQKTVNIQVVELKNEIIFNDLVVSGNIISGLENLNHTVIDIKNKIETTYRVEIYNSKDEVLPDNQLVGTGCKIKFFDESDNLAIEYNILYYGDVNGDGKINSIDLLVLQRHILEINLLNRCICQSW